MQSAIKYRESVDACLEHVEIIKNQKVGKLSLADELKAVNQMNIDQLDDKNLKDEIERLFKEFKSDYLPKLVMKNEGIRNINV
jgi:hypothetical protein